MDDRRGLVVRGVVVACDGVHRPVRVRVGVDVLQLVVVICADGRG